MKLIVDEINKLKLPEPKFALEYSFEYQAIALKPMTQIELLPDTGLISRLVNKELLRGGRVNFSLNESAYHINVESMASSIFEMMLSALRLTWMKANKKVDFDRTKFSDVVLKALHCYDKAAFQDEVVSLYIDLEKHGITDVLIEGKDLPTLGIFFASKFEQAARRYGS